ncbi:MAG: CPBP family intramembrane metalloprotease [Nitrospirae bacterium]|nr:CPBP family intramembrane metalloprotease [Nitrospirota bacterium]
MEPKISRGRLLLLAILTELGALLCAAAMSWYYEFNLIPAPKSVLKESAYGILFAAFPFALFVFTLSKSADNIGFLRKSRRFMLKEIKGLFSEARVVDIFFISIIAGICEEAFFRGALQLKMGLITSSLIFGLFHFINPVYFVFATLMGLYLGALYSFTGTLLAPMLCHFAYDFAALCYLLNYAND